MISEARIETIDSPEHGDAFLEELYRLAFARAVREATRRKVKDVEATIATLARRREALRAQMATKKRGIADGDFAMLAELRGRQHWLQAARGGRISIEDLNRWSWGPYDQSEPAPDAKPLPISSRHVA